MSAGRLGAVAIVGLIIVGSLVAAELRNRVVTNAHLQARVTELEGALEQIRTELDSLGDQVEAFDAHVGDLETAVDEFSSRDWRQVVPQVRDAAENLRTTVGDVRQHVEDAKQHLP